MAQRERSKSFVGILRELYGTEDVTEPRRVAVAQRYKAINATIANDHKPETKTTVEDLKEFAHLSLIEGEGCVDIMEDLVARLEKGIKPKTIHGVGTMMRPVEGCAQQ